MTLLFFLPTISSLIAPVFLVLIEQLLPYPHIVEEVAKAAIVLGSPKISKLRNKVAFAALLGFCFALSETIFWWGSFFDSGLALFIRKLALISILHVATYSILILSITKSKRGIILGLAAATVVHYFFNLWGMQALFPFN